jgi:hypothetical protein
MRPSSPSLDPSNVAGYKALWERTLRERERAKARYSYDADKKRKYYEDNKPDILKKRKVHYTENHDEVRQRQWEYRQGPLYAALHSASVACRRQCEESHQQRHYRGQGV